jgi:hypothetical protein
LAAATWSQVTRRGTKWDIMGKHGRQWLNQGKQRLFKKIQSPDQDFRDWHHAEYTSNRARPLLF